MKYYDKEITELDDWQLHSAYNDCKQTLVRRDEAAKHPKFNNENKKLELPPVNPKFTQLFNEIENEMKKRKLI